MWLDFESPAGPRNRIRVECRTGTTLGAITAAVAMAPGPWWCGPHMLQPEDVAGTAPLCHAALVTPEPAPAGPLWPGPRLISVAGPDVGRVVALTHATTVGSASPDGWRDPSIDPRHATVDLGDGARVSITDSGSTNGVRSWDPDYPQRWSPRRRRLWLDSGAYAAIGATIVQFHSAHTATAPLFGGLAWLDPTARLNPTSRIADPATHAWSAHGGAWSRAWWNGALSIEGPHRVGLTRAIALARGRRLPSPSPLAEPWHDLLPPADAHDAPVCWAEPARGGGGDELIRVVTSSRGAALSFRSESLTIPLCSVSADSAERIARAIAAATPLLPPLLTRGDLPVSPGIGVGVGVGAGDSTSGDVTPPDAVWTLPADRAWLVLVTGAPGTGKSTTLATLFAASIETCDGGRAALRVVDDAHLLDTQALRRVVDVALQRDPHESIAIAADRATGTFPPELIARADALVCLRTRTADESRDFIGVGDAASLPESEPGLAYVRSAGIRRLVRIALPSTVPSAAARIL